MSKHIQLNIADPCHENWDNMTPATRGKFCGSCQKQVIDFSNMSDREVAQFFKRPSTGSVCGRFMQDQLDRSIQIPKKRIPWVKYFFQFALPAFLVSCGARTQGKIKVDESKTEIATKSTCSPTVGIISMESETIAIPDTTETIFVGDIEINKISKANSSKPFKEEPLIGDTTVLSIPVQGKLI